METSESAVLDDPKNFEGRFERSKEAVKKAVDFLKEQEPATVEPSRSPIEALLEPMRDEIKKLLKKHTARKVAQVIRSQGAEFDAESIRQRIVKMFPNERGDRTRRTRTTAKPTPQPTPTKSAADGSTPRQTQQPGTDPFANALRRP
ncbi:MAG TPA: hypothetical protein VFO29_11875 [Candidatus Rubrimentiphilum sp.]|nr:hypothetical protein [Candidatus Rubrimentiphilum sp.]